MKHKRGLAKIINTIRELPHHRHGTVSANAASTANYLTAVGNVLHDSAGTLFNPRGAQFIGFSRTVPYVEPPGVYNPLTGHGDAWQMVNTYGLNTIRLPILWDRLAPNPATLVSPGVYAHDWTDAAGTLNLNYDTADGYLAIIDKVLQDARGLGLRVILVMHQSGWSSAFDPNSVGFPAWLYPPTPGATYTSGVSPTDQSVAKWEFFQPSGGYARTGIVGPPQDLLVDLWKFLCTRFKDNDTIVGIDFLNEPGWPTAHPLPASPSGIATSGHTPTDVDLVAFYNKCFTMARGIQSRWLLIYENGTYANTVAGRSPLTSASTPPSGSNVVMSWHYYPDNPNNGTGPAGTGTAPALADITTFKGYLEAQRALAQDTFGHPFWVGETNMFSHIENNVAHRLFDYPDTPALLNTTLTLWEALWHDFIDDVTANNYGWSVYSFQYANTGQRSFLQSNGTPKTDIIDAALYTPAPPGGFAGGVAVPITYDGTDAGQVAVGPNTDTPADKSFVVIGADGLASPLGQFMSQKWKDQFYDKGIFGRWDKTPPTLAHDYTGDLVINSDGTAVGTVYDPVDSTGGAPAAGAFTVSTDAGGRVVLTFDCKVKGTLTINGPSDPTKLIVTGKLWVVNPAGTGANTFLDYNTLFSFQPAGGQALFVNCTPWLVNCYMFGSSGDQPMIRFQNCRAHPDGDKPYMDGFCLDAVTRDGIKGGQGTKDPWFRHGTIGSHAYARAATDTSYPAVDFPATVGNPTGGPGSLLFVDTTKMGAWTDPKTGPQTASLSNPPLWEAGATYAQYQVVASDTSKTSNRYWSQHVGNIGNLVGDQQTPGLGLGGSDTHWRFLGDTHSDMGQYGHFENDQTRAAYENVFFYQPNHTGIFNQGVGDTNGHNQTDLGTYTPGTVYKAVNASGKQDQVRIAPHNRAYICIADTDGTQAPPDPTHWATACAYGIWGQYCLAVFNSGAITNNAADNTNGFRDSFFSYGAHNPIQGTGLGDATNAHTLNINNAYGDNAGIPGNNL